MLFASWLSAQQLWQPYLGWQEHNSLVAIVLCHYYDKMLKGEYVSSSDRCWTFDVLRRKIELNYQGPLKMVLDFNIRSRVWKKMVELVYFFPSRDAHSQNIIKTTLKIKQFLCFNIQQWNSLQPHGDYFFNLSLI